jgi:RNA polymerase sigma factor (sigma-70 family)
MHCIERFADRYVIQALDFEPDLRRYLYRLTHNPSDVEELLQEVYMRLLAEGASVGPELLSVRRFAFKVAHDVAVDLIRRRDLVPMEELPKLEIPNQSDEEGGVEEIVGRAKERLRLMRAIDDLPPRCREVMALLITDGCGRSEIANRLGISLNTVKDHLKRAVRLLTPVMLYGPDNEPGHSRLDILSQQEAEQ